MKKTILKLALLGIAISVLAVPLISAAQGPNIPAPSWDNPPNVMVVLERVADGLFAILLVVAAIFITIAAYFFVVAQGEPEKIKKARDFVLYTLVGVLLAFLAKGLVYLVATIVGVDIPFWW